MMYTFGLRNRSSECRKRRKNLEVESATMYYRTIRYVSPVRERILLCLTRFIVVIAEDSEGPSLRRSCEEQRVSRGANSRFRFIRRICKGRCVVRIWSLSWTELFTIQQSREPIGRLWFVPACEVSRCYRNFNVTPRVRKSHWKAKLVFFFSF